MHRYDLVEPSRLGSQTCRKHTKRWDVLFLNKNYRIRESLKKILTWHKPKETCCNASQRTEKCLDKFPCFQAFPGPYFLFQTLQKTTTPQIYSHFVSVIKTSSSYQPIISVETLILGLYWWCANNIGNNNNNYTSISLNFEIQKLKMEMYQPDQLYQDFCDCYIHILLYKTIFRSRKRIFQSRN